MLGSVISRVSGLEDQYDNTILAGYQYLGDLTIVQQDTPQTRGSMLSSKTIILARALEPQRLHRLLPLESRSDCRRRSRPC
jgi:hypothetical protein